MSPIIDHIMLRKVELMIDRNRQIMERGRQLKNAWSRLKIGAVSYLNSKPLIQDLADLCPDADLILDYPSRLADELAAGRLDVALIPSVEAFLDSSYEIVSDACVATHGPVLSVKLYSRVPPGQIRTLALDEGSRTSAALSQILLHERYGVRPTLENLPLQNSTSDTQSDAVLLIGDRAMATPAEQFHTTWDLGEEWVNWTGLPFVFAMWVTRRETELGDIPSQLSGARNRGLQQIDRIACEGANALDLSESTAHEYLTKNLYFHLGAAESAGLKLFQELAADLGLASKSSLRFRKSQSPSQSKLIST